MKFYRFNELIYRIRPIKRTVPNKRIPPYFSRLEGEWLAQLSWKMQKTSPRRSKKSKIKYLLLPCLQTSTEFRHFSSSFVLSLYIFAAWLNYWPINDLFACSERISTLNSESAKDWRCNDSLYAPTGNHWGVRQNGWLPTSLLQKIFSTPTRTVRLIGRIQYISIRSDSIHRKA